MTGACWSNPRAKPAFPVPSQSSATPQTRTHANYQFMTFMTKQGRRQTTSQPILPKLTESELPMVQTKPLLTNTNSPSKLHRRFKGDVRMQKFKGLVLKDRAHSNQEERLSSAFVIASSSTPKMSEPGLQIISAPSLAAVLGVSQPKPEDKKDQEVSNSLLSNELARKEKTQPNGTGEGR